MSARAALLKKLIDSPNSAVERAIEVALLQSVPVEQKELAAVIMERNRRPGWAALIRTYHRLDDSIREKIFTRPRDLFGPLTDTMKDSEGPTRENVIHIVQRCADVSLVHLLVEALMDSRAEVRTMAANSLLEVVRRSWNKKHAETEQEKIGDPHEFHQLGLAVTTALRHYKTHRQAPALMASLIHERQQDAELWLLFQDPYDDRTRAANIILRAPSEPALAASLLLALASSLKPAAMAGLAAVESAPIARALAAESFRLIDPLLHEPAQGINHLKLFPALRKEPPWNTATWSSWLRLIEHVGLQPQERLSWLTKMLEAAPAGPEGSAWKIFVTRAIAETNLPDAAIPVAALVRDPDERVARIAARSLLNGRRPDWRERAALILPTSPHLSVRRLSALSRSLREPESAAPTPAKKGFEKAWKDYQKMPPAVRHATARNMTTDPALADQLKIKFDGPPQDVAQALKMISSLPNLTPYRKELIKLCGHADPRIAAMAIRLIGRLEDPKLKELLEAALHHADGRVRANAVESMEELHIADRSQQVMAMLNSRHNRERANAIKALGQFNFATARECLERMLTDSNPLHRMSALWVVGQLNLMETLRQVSIIARRDPNLRVRRKAAEMLENLSGTFGN